MKQILPSKFRHRFTCLLLLVLALFIANKTNAQCPVASNCTPGNPPAGNLVFGMGILNVNINNGDINNTSPAVTATTGYVDFSCNTSASLTASLNYPVSIRTNNNVPENVMIWVDLDNNGVFHATAELVFSSIYMKLHTGTINIPAIAVTGVPLRMRISADNFASPLPTPCSTSQYSQVEDYTIVVWPNAQPPIAAFSVSSQTSCSGTEQFNDISTNGPTSWKWIFGDPASGAANTSTLQNPTHTFSAPGVYTIKLVVTNQYGADSITRVNFINYSPANSFCTNITMPATGTRPVATGCNGAIYDPGGPTGQYPNSANSIVTIAPAGAVLVKLNFTAFDLETYNDELYIYDGPSTSSQLIGVFGGNTLPNGGTITSTGPALTLRFVSNNYSRYDGFAATWSCIMPMKPDADLKANLDSICTGLVKFKDISASLPTSWQWDFGDPASGAANTSTLQNPTHTYSNTVPGAYTVKLIACNSLGCDTIVKTNYIKMTVPCLTYCASQNHANAGQWIDKVTFGNLNNSSGADPNGYGNYTTQNSNITLGTANAIAVRLGSKYSSGFVTIWIDLDKDGVFQASEKLFHKNATYINTGDPMIASGTIAIPNSVQSGTTRMRVVYSYDYQQNDPCVSNLNPGETEDYSVTFLPNNTPLAGGFTGSLNSICTGTVQFKDASVNGATSWLWNFGDPASGAANTSTLQNPTHAYSTTTSASYDVSLIVCKGTQCDTIIKPNYINVPVPCATYCISDGHSNASYWISNVSFGGINNTTSAEANGYGNYTNLKGNLVVNSTANPFSVTLGYNSSVPYKQVHIWIDFNKNGFFEQTEKVFSAPAWSVNQPIANGNIIVPSTAQPGFTRMRVIMSHGSSDLSDACSKNLYESEAEDYTVNLLPNNLPVTANFKPDMTNICSGSVPFSDVSSNGATSWQWNFGDPASGAANTSTLQNPTHNYSTATAGSFDVTLIACKGSQCDTITKTNLINISVPCRTYCVSAGHSVGPRWISNVTIGSIYNPTGAEINGYGNYTYLSTDLMLGVPNPLNVNIINAGLYMYVFAWVDFNQDSVFSANERVFNELTKMNAAGIVEAIGKITLPGNALPGLTRMRIMMTPYSYINDPCQKNFPNTEVEDYLVNILPNPDPVVANFKANMDAVCQGTVKFSDASSNGATSWFWNFGDPASGAANTSTLQSPIHNYPVATSGSYDVSLIACKAGLCDTLVYTKSVNITVPCISYCYPNYNSNLYQWIENVSIGNIRNNSGADANAYGNYTYLNTAAHASSGSIPVTVSLGKPLGVAEYIMIWIDFNKDGTFQPSEQVFNQLAQFANGKLEAKGSFVIPVTAILGPTRMRVMMRQHGGSYDACVSSSSYVEVEDYTMMILQNPVPPVTDFSADVVLSCYGTVKFTDTSVNVPTTWRWNFGDPNSGAANTSVLQNPNHNFSTPGVYTISLITTNAFGSDTLTKTNYINYDPLNTACQTVLMPVSGTILSNKFCTGSLYDNGGPSGFYSNNVDGTVVIAPPNAASVSLTFTYFNVHSPYDVLKVYDGPNTASPLLGVYYTTSVWGNAIPNNGAPIISTGGAMTIQFTSDSSTPLNGFSATWNCNMSVGISEDLNNAIFEVYPNPSSGLVNLKLKQNHAEAFNLEVTNVLGEVLLKQPMQFSDSQSQQLDLGKFGKGVYFIRIQNDKTSGIRKVVLD